MRAEVRGENVSATGVLLSLIQSKGALLLPLGWETVSGADPYGAC